MIGRLRGENPPGGRATAAITVAFSNGQNRKGNRNAASEAAAEIITAPKIMQSDRDLQHPTPRQECRFLIRDSRKRLWTLGIENDGDERLNAPRQAVVLGRFEGVHWSPINRLVTNWYVYAPTASADDKGGSTSRGRNGTSLTRSGLSAHFTSMAKKTRRLREGRAGRWVPSTAIPCGP